MDRKTKKNKGLQLLITQYRKMFRIPENLNCYSVEDYKKAEKLFIKHMLRGDA